MGTYTLGIQLIPLIISDIINGREGRNVEGNSLLLSLMP